MILMTILSIIGLLIYIGFAVVTHIFFGYFNPIVFVTQLLGLILLFVVALKLINRYFREPR